MPPIQFKEIVLIILLTYIVGQTLIQAHSPSLNMEKKFTLKRRYIAGFTLSSYEIPFQYSSEKITFINPGFNSLEKLGSNLITPAINCIKALHPKNRVQKLFRDYREIKREQNQIGNMASFKNSNGKIGGGLLSTTKKGLVYIPPENEDLHNIAKKFRLPEWRIARANNLFSYKVKTGHRLFIPIVSGNAEHIYTLVSKELKKSPKNTDLFSWPLRANITSNFGIRVHPILRTRCLHNGIDLKAPEGEKISSAADGVVTLNSYDRFSGNKLVVEHRSGFKTIYIHCKKIFVKKGEFIRKGEIIASVGNTGRSTAPHLHFSIQKDNIYLNPIEHLSGNP
ncbi:M23 family metallopeptidase [Candidatus Riflebacteria bacterium]